jgi:DNA-directed RNA polymerase omega subunit
MMPDTDKPAGDGSVDDAGDANWPGIDSRFRLVLVAAQRSKQIQRGARPRIVSDPKRRRPTSIALEEVRRGLVPFINNTKDPPREGGDSPRAEPAATAADV